jgi:hypothetical protein
MRTTSIRRVPSLGLALLLAACTAADPTPLDPVATGRTAPPSVAASTTEPTPPPAPTATPPPQPTGTLLVWQLDGLDGATATTESIYRLDVANGATAPIATIPVNEMTCCPTSVTFSGDRTTAFLYAGSYRGAVDLATGTFTKASGRIPRGNVAISLAGDRLAWVDDVTGTSESIVIGGRHGKTLQRIALPAGAFVSIPAWTADDDALLVTTMLPLKTASDIRLASTIACCSIDRGVQATHVLVVPLDGSSVRDVYDDAAEVSADQGQPDPTHPPGSTTGFAWPASHSLRAWPGPDPRTALVVTEACPSQWRARGTERTCTDELLTIDTETGQRTSLPVPLTRISSAGWSPDGRRLSLLGSEGGGPTGLYVVDRAGGNVVDLGPAEPELMAWSPDGAWIAFWQLDPRLTDGDRVQVWVAPTTGGDARFVAGHASAGWLGP